MAPSLKPVRIRRRPEPLRAPPTRLPTATPTDLDRAGVTADLARAADLTIAPIMNAGVSASMVAGIGTTTIITIITGAVGATGIAMEAVDRRRCAGRPQA